MIESELDPNEKRRVGLGVAKDNGDSGNDSGPKLVPQPHGGALLSGGMPGNKGGRGYPSEIKHALRDIAAESLPKIREFALGMVRQIEEREVTLTCPECDHSVSAKVEFEFVGPPKGSDQARVWDMVLKHGLDVEVDKTLVDDLWDVIEQHTPPDSLPTVRREWNRIIGEKLVEAVVT